MKEKILRKMFEENDENFAGYENIVNTLITTGKSISTLQARDIEFGQTISKYIEITPVDVSLGVGLIEIKLDIFNAVKDVRYTEILKNIYYNIDEKIKEIEYELAHHKSLQNDIVKMLDDIGDNK